MHGIIMKYGWVLFLLVMMTGFWPAAASPVEELAAQGNMLYDQDQYEEALIILDQALAIDPDHLEALNGKGKTLKSLGRYE